MDLIGFLGYYAPFALGVFVLGVGLKLGRWAKAVPVKNTFSDRSKNAVAPPEREGFFEALVKVLHGPVENFYLKANRGWALGYMLYHVGIVTIVAGYTVSGVILLVNVLAGNPVPDVAAGVAESGNYSLVNLLAIVFGNAEHLEAEFLFGNLAPVFVTVTWIAVGFALVGNLALLVSTVRKRSGEVVSDLESATEGVRTTGDFDFEHFFVAVLVFGIILTEIMARLHVVPDMVFYHVALGLTVFLVTPFTYLVHILFTPITVMYAVKRRMNRTIA